MRLAPAHPVVAEHRVEVGEAVGGGVAGRSEVTDEGGDGGEDHEEVEGVLAGQPVQVDQAVGLGAEQPGEALPVAVGAPLVGDARQVEHAVRGSEPVPGGGQRRAEFIGPGHVGAQREHLGAEAGQRAVPGASPLVGLGAADQHQLGGVVAGEMLGEDTADGTGAAGHDVHAAVPQGHVGRGGRGCECAQGTDLPLARGRAADFQACGAGRGAQFHHHCPGDLGDRRLGVDAEGEQLQAGCDRPRGAGEPGQRGPLGPVLAGVPGVQHQAPHPAGQHAGAGRVEHVQEGCAGAVEPVCGRAAVRVVENDGDVEPVLVSEGGEPACVVADGDDAPPHTGRLQRGLQLRTAVEQDEGPGGVRRFGIGGGVPVRLVEAGFAGGGVRPGLCGGRTVGWRCLSVGCGTNGRHRGAGRGVHEGPLSAGQTAREVPHGGEDTTLVVVDAQVEAAHPRRLAGDPGVCVADLGQRGEGVQGSEAEGDGEFTGARRGGPAGPVAGPQGTVEELRWQLGARGGSGPGQPDQRLAGADPDLVDDLEGGAVREPGGRVLGVRGGAVAYDGETGAQRGQVLGGLRGGGGRDCPAAGMGGAVGTGPAVHLEGQPGSVRAEGDVKLRFAVAGFDGSAPHHLAQGVPGAGLGERGGGADELERRRAREQRPALDHVVAQQRVVCAQRLAEADLRDGGLVGVDQRMRSGRAQVGVERYPVAFRGERVPRGGYPARGGPRPAGVPGRPVHVGAAQPAAGRAGQRARVREVGGRAAFGEPAERVGEFAAVGDCHREPGVEGLAAHLGGEAQVGERHALGPDEAGGRLGVGAQPFLVAGGEQEQHGFAGALLARRHIGDRVRIRGLLEDEVRVGAARAEGAEAGPARPVPVGPFGQLSLDPER